MGYTGCTGIYTDYLSLYKHIYVKVLNERRYMDMEGYKKNKKTQGFQNLIFFSALGPLS